MTAEPVDTDIVYTYRPSLLGAPWQFTLGADGIRWSAGRRSGLLRYDAVRRVRLSYRPANMQSYRFVTEVWGEGAPRLRIVSSSWKSMFEQERLDKPYATFVAALHRRLADTRPPVRYEQGLHPLQFWPVLAVFAGVALGLVVLIVRALQQSALGGAAFIAAFLAFFAWQGWNYLGRNRPGTYHVDSVPLSLLPKG